MAPLGRRSTAKGDAAHHKQRFEEVQCKFERLEGQARAKGGKRRLFKKETARMREERDRLEEKNAVRSKAERTGFERDVTWLEGQSQPCEKVMVASQCPCGVLLYCHHPKRQEILPSHSVLLFSCLGRSTRCGGSVFLLEF